jgi:hypothetical protein
MDNLFTVTIIDLNNSKPAITMIFLLVLAGAGAVASKFIFTLLSYLLLVKEGEDQNSIIIRILHIYIQFFI